MMEMTRHYTKISPIKSCFTAIAVGLNVMLAMATVFLPTEV